MTRRDEPNRDQKPWPEPHLNDLIIIDGRWAKIIGKGGPDLSFKFIDDDFIERATWDAFELVQDFSHRPTLANFDLMGSGFAGMRQDLIATYLKAGKEFSPQMFGKLFLFGIYSRKKKT